MDPYAFNLGRDLNFQFGAPSRLMAEDIKVIIEGDGKPDGILKVSVDRPVRLGMEARDFAVQWHRDGKAIPWENERVYHKRPEDRGHVIGCWVTDAKHLGSELVCVE